MSISKGSANIGKVYAGTAEVGKVYIGDKLVYRSGPSIDPVFANNDWATIRTVVRSGNIPATWAVGDTKDITLSNGQTVSYRICDMQTGRYALADGSGSSNMVLEPIVQISNLKAKMNANGSNSGSFAQSEMRTITLVNVLALFPTDAQDAMSEVLVLSGTGGGTTSGTSSSANKLFLAAEMELFASRLYSIGNAECPLGQFDYYKTHNNNSDRIKQRDGSNQSYWLRSPESGHGSSFCFVAATGYVSSLKADAPYGVAPFFAI